MYIGSVSPASAVWTTTPRTLTGIGYDALQLPLIKHVVVPASGYVTIKPAIPGGGMVTILGEGLAGVQWKLDLSDGTILGNLFTAASGSAVFQTLAVNPGAYITLSNIGAVDGYYWTTGFYFIW